MHKFPLTPLAALVLALLLLFAAGPAVAQGLGDPIPGPIPQGDVVVGFETVASGMVAPLYGIHAGDGSGRLFVADQVGPVWAIDLATKTRTLFLDLTPFIIAPNPIDERGLMGQAFHPDYAQNGLLYTFTSEFPGPPADFTVQLPFGFVFNHQSVVTEWRVPAPGDRASVPDLASRRVILRIDQPQINHNGGTLAFGTDRLLYISIGDGGNRDDEGAGHGFFGNGQDMETALGTMLRIDVDARTSANGQYGVPAGNPFVGGPGIDEIFAYGFRNPYRFSIDHATGDIHLGDVGQGAIEEIDLVMAGGNYGWNLKEGSFFFFPNGFLPGFVTDVDPGVPPGLIDPVAEYDHDEGIAVIGGFVYRGDRIAKLQGRYVFAEFLKRLLYIDGDGVMKEMQLEAGAQFINVVMGMGQDEAGELYVIGNANGFAGGASGVARKLLPPDTDGDGHRDPDDNCPYTPNADQADAGGVGEGSAPDGIGNVCQCADVNMDGFVTKADFKAIIASLRPGNNVPLQAPDLCDAGGEPGCAQEDAVIVRIALTNKAPRRIAQQCPPALP
ncbi:MAG: PQQ-dependent sugar dehydrogenase [Deltaproteobacteria bacterium]|nr:PQQ-dependent sugar dehydrogenase [Deltaproteobacteria bacterium]